MWLQYRVRVSGFASAANAAAASANVVAAAASANGVADVAASAAFADVVAAAAIHPSLIFLFRIV